MAAYPDGDAPIQSPGALRPSADPHVIVAGMFRWSTGDQDGTQVAAGQSVRPSSLSCWFQISTASFSAAV